MPVYEYVCRSCHTKKDIVRSIHDEVPQHLHCACGYKADRIYTSVAFHRFTEHFNTTLGKTVSSKKSFETGLHEAQERMTERLGWQQHYAVVENPERKNDEGMQATHDNRKALGLST